MKLSAVITFVCATVLFSQHVESKPFLKNLLGGIFGGGKKGGSSGGYGQSRSSHGHMQMGGYGGGSKRPDFGAIFSKIPQLIGRKVGIVSGLASKKIGLVSGIPAKIGGLVGGISGKLGGLGGGKKGGGGYGSHGGHSMMSSGYGSSMSGWN